MDFILCRSWASRAITTAIPVDAGAGGYWHLHCIANFKGAKVTPPFRQVDDPNVILENYVMYIFTISATCNQHPIRVRQHHPGDVGTRRQVAQHLLRGCLFLKYTPTH